MAKDAIMLIDMKDPDSPKWHKALASDDRDKWLEGAQAELCSLEEMEVFELVPHSSVPSN